MLIFKVSSKVLCLGIILVIGGLFTEIYAQTNNVNSNISANVSIVATATVVDAIEMSTLANIRLGSASIGSDEIFINPQSDDMSGKLLVTGRPNAAIRITYVPQRELSLIGGPQTLTFRYLLAGNSDDDQINSEALNESRTNMALGSDGRFFIWIGGRVNILNATFGQYEGEFSVEIEYI